MYMNQSQKCTLSVLCAIPHTNSHRVYESNNMPHENLDEVDAEWKAFYREN